MSTLPKELLFDSSKHPICPDEFHPSTGDKKSKEYAAYIKECADTAYDSEFYGTAKKFYLEAIDIYPEFPGALLNYGLMLDLEGKYEEELEYVNRALTIDPIYGDALWAKCVTYYKMRKYDKSLMAIDDLLKYYDYQPAKNLRDRVSQNIKVVSDKAKAIDSAYEYDQVLKIAYHYKLISEISHSIIPELDMLSEDFYWKILGKLIDVSETEEKMDPFVYVCLWMFYAGVGAVCFWKVDWPELKKTGLYQSLIGDGDVMDLEEEVLNLSGVGYDSEHGQWIRKAAKVTAYLSMTKIDEIREELGNEKDQKLKNIEATAYHMYHCGILFQLQWFDCLI